MCAKCPSGSKTLWLIAAGVFLLLGHRIVIQFYPVPVTVDKPFSAEKEEVFRGKYGITGSQVHVTFVEEQFFSPTNYYGISSDDIYKIRRALTWRYIVPSIPCKIVFHSMTNATIWLDRELVSFRGAEKGDQEWHIGEVKKVQH